MIERGGDTFRLLGGLAPACVTNLPNTAGRSGRTDRFARDRRSASTRKPRQKDDVEVRVDVDVGTAPPDRNRLVGREIGEGVVDLVLHASFDELEDAEREELRVEWEVRACLSVQHLNRDVVVAVAHGANVEVDVDLGIGTVGVAGKVEIDVDGVAVHALDLDRCAVELAPVSGAEVQEVPDGALDATFELARSEDELVDERRRRVLPPGAVTAQLVV